MANNWAIVVGVNKYDFLRDAALQFAVNDALAMQAWLCDAAGFPEPQILLCGDGTAGTKKATRPVLRDILLHQLERASKADNLWFFFSGHGLAGSDQQDYLMPIDGNPKDLQDTAISINFVTDKLRACRARNIVLILDMCRNESRDTGRKSAESVEASLRQLVKDSEGQQGIITLFSCGRGQSSYELTTVQQGAFTHALLEGLQQTSILKDLATYLARRVPELHRESGQATQQQVPLVIPAPGWKYEEPLLSNYVTATDVSRLKEMAIDAECDREIEKAIRLWEQVNLLATNANDRRRALNKIRHLIVSSTPAQTADLITENITANSPAQSESIDWDLDEEDMEIEIPDWSEPRLSLPERNLPDWSEPTLRPPKSSCIIVFPYNSREALVRWTINFQTHKYRIQSDGYSFVLRLYDITEINSKDVLPPTFEQFDADESAQEQRILIPKSGRRYMVVMGYLTRSGAFLKISRSATVLIFNRLTIG